MSLCRNYYFSALSWSIVQKVLAAIIGVFSTPLLLGVFGKAEYGLISIAGACNGYMHILDLGMNTGAVRFFSIWKSEGSIEKMYRVARTNLSFYGIIAFINILFLILVAAFGECLFSISHDQFLKLRVCLYILSVFSLANWMAAAYDQLLIADKQISFTRQMSCISLLVKVVLLICVLKIRMSLTTYYFFLVASAAFLIVPYAWKCLHDKLIDSLWPAAYWKEFKPVLTYSLSIFALSVFQMTAAQSRPIVLSMFAQDGAISVTDFSILSVFPNLVITIGGTFSGIFLPKVSEMVAKGDEKAIKSFVYLWTSRTSVIINILTIPLVLSAKELLCAYVGEEYSSLSIWLAIWCFTVLIQMHTTPANAVILAKGKTTILVVSTAFFCALSIILNVLLCPYFQVGAAIIAYAIYVVLVIGLYYFYYYKKLMDLERKKMVMCFLKPSILAIIIMIAVSYIPFNVEWFKALNERIACLLISAIKSITWLVPYLLLIRVFKVEKIKNLIPNK